MESGIGPLEDEAILEVAAEDERHDIEKQLAGIIPRSHTTPPIGYATIGFSYSPDVPEIR
jgi:hypothetical protein